MRREPWNSGSTTRNPRSTGELLLSELLGTRVISVDGIELGRVDDAVVRLGDPHPTIRRLHVRPGRRRGPDASSVLDPATITSLGPDLLVVDGGVAGNARQRLRADEVLLGRDVLDTQVVDLDGRRLVRVGDVVLADDGTGGLAAVAVDIGFGSVCRRLGLHQLGERLGTEAVAWDVLHLTSAQGHAVQLATPSATLHRLGAEELGLLLDAVPIASGIELVRGVHPDVAASALAATHPHTTRRIVGHLHAHEIDDLAGRLPEHHARRLRTHPTPGAPPNRRLRRHAGWRRRGQRRPVDAP